MVSLVYAILGFPFGVWLIAMGGFSWLTVGGALLAPLSIVVLLTVPSSSDWLLVWPMGVAPLFACSAGAHVSGQPALFMALLMGSAAMSGLHESRRSVLLTWMTSTAGYVHLAMSPLADGSWGSGGAAIVSLTHLSVSLVVYFKAEQHRCALAEAQRAARDAEAALAVATDAARTRERFVANMTHELRTPLTGIIGMVQLLPRELSPNVREIAETIDTSANSLLEIVNDVLNFSKGKSGTLELRLAPMAPADVLRDAVRAVATQAHQKRLELLLDLAPNLPSAIAGDELRLRQVVLNLLGNALKFTEHGHVTVRARLSNSPLALLIEVEDTGIGIPKERLAAVFEAFVQVDDSPARRHRGTGLGLTITRQLVELMGGTVELESELGRGSLFRVCLPLDPNDVRVPLVMLERWLEDRRVALLAEAPGARSFLKRTMEGAGALVTEADHLVALSALLQAHQGTTNHFDAAVIDFSPEARWSDVTAAAELAPVVVLVTDAQRASAPQTVGPGMVFVEKPYTARDLQSVFHQLAIGKLDRVRVAPRAEPRSGLDVLVVEDNAINAKVAQGFLSRLGHRSFVAKNGLEALRELGLRRYDAVLMDMQMPDMDGLETTRRIRAREAEAGLTRMPIFMVSANSEAEDEVACTQSGTDAFLTKPIVLERLQHLLDGVKPDAGTKDGGA